MILLFVVTRFCSCANSLKSSTSARFLLHNKRAARSTARQRSFLMAKGKKSYKRQDQKGQKDAEVSVHVNGVAQESAVAVGSTEPISSKSSDDFAPTPAMTASNMSEPTPPTSVAASTLPLSSAASDALPSPSQQQAVQQPSASHFRPSGNDSICDHIFNGRYCRALVHAAYIQSDSTVENFPMSLCKSLVSTLIEPFDYIG